MVYPAVGDTISMPTETITLDGTQNMINKQPLDNTITTVGKGRFLLSGTDPSSRPPFLTKPLQFEINLIGSFFGDAGVQEVRVNKLKATALVITKSDITDLTYDNKEVLIGP